MKKFLSVLCASVFSFSAFGAAISVVAEEPDRAPTLMLAQILGQQEVDEYRGDFAYLRTGVSPEGKQPEEPWLYGSFRLNLDFLVTFVEIDGDVIFEDYAHPKAGLPGDRFGGIQDFQIYLAGYKQGEEVEYGHSYYPYLDPREGVKITLRPDWQEEVIPFDSPAGVNPENLRIIGSQGEDLGWYDERSEMFHVWLNPLDGEIEYQIVDLATGDVLATGTLSPVASPTADNVNPLNVDYVDGIEKLVLGEAGDWYKPYPDQYFSGQDYLADILVPSKVFILKRDEWNDTGVDLWGFDGVIAAFREGLDGQLEDWPLAFPAQEWPEPEGISVKSGGEGPWSGVVVPAGPSKVWLVFYGDEDFDGLFSAAFSVGGVGLG